MRYKGSWSKELGHPRRHYVLLPVARAPGQEVRAGGGDMGGRWSSIVYISSLVSVPASPGPRQHWITLPPGEILKNAWLLCCKNVSGSNQYFPWQWMINNEWMRCQENSVGPVKNVPLIVFPLWCAVTMCCSLCREHILTRKHGPRTVAVLCLTHLSHQNGYIWSTLICSISCKLFREFWCEMDTELVILVMWIWVGLGIDFGHGSSY